jgi:glycosyltransferase involved in cell wall biosynthesis
MSESAEQGIHRVDSRVVLLDPEDRMMRLDAVRGLDDVLRAQRFDVVHIQTPFIAHHAGVRLARRIVNLPVVATFHTHFEEYLSHYVPMAPRTLLRWLVRSFTRRQARQVDALVVPSRAIHTLLSDYGVTTPRHIIPTGIDLHRFQGGEGQRFRARLGISPETPLLLFVGRLAHEKNIGFLLHVLKRVRRTLPRAQFVIAGEGPAAGSLRRCVAELRLQDAVHIVGNIPDREGLLDCYRAADCFVFASHTETQGLVLLEAMALGVPVVASAILGTRDILDPQRGAVVVEPNEEAFSAAVCRVLTQQMLSARLSREGVQYVQEWSIGATAARMERLYADLIGSHAIADAPASVPPQREERVSRLPQR